MMKTSFNAPASEKSISQSCGSCRYYKPFETDEEQNTDDEEEEDDPETVTGVCRRYPPQLFPGIVSTTAWPEVSDKSGWCGEYTPEG